MFAVSVMEQRPPVSSPSRSTLWVQDLGAALLAGWITLGGFVDGFAHRNLNTPETFFTPWHGVLYSGYLATAAYLVFLVGRRRSEAASLREAIPPGYDTALAGVVIFALGGLGDMWWHTLFGIEVAIDALLSPTHLMLLVGSVLMLSGPIRSAWARTGTEPGFKALAPALIALTMATAQLGFFFQYADGFSVRVMQAPYVPVPYVPGANDEANLAAVYGISAVLLTTVIVMGPLLLFIRRWRLPKGAGILFFSTLGLLMALLEGFQYPESIIAPLIAGIGADLLIHLLAPSPERRRQLRLFAWLVPMGLWAARAAVVTAVYGMGWPVAMWSGLIVMAGLLGLGLSLLVVPPGHPARPG